jgi:hypothetical protein
LFNRSLLAVTLLTGTAGATVVAQALLEQHCFETELLPAAVADRAGKLDSTARSGGGKTSIFLSTCAQG